jgi:hypothetical protein
LVKSLKEIVEEETNVNVTGQIPEIKKLDHQEPKVLKNK